MLKFSALTLALIFGFVHLLEANNPLPVERNQVRRDETLRQIAEKLTNSLNNDVDPCTSAAKHVCTDSEASSSQQNQRGAHLRWDNMEDILRKVNENDPEVSEAEIKLKYFVLSRDSTDKKEQFENLNVAKMMGGWPIVTKNWNENNLDWIRVTAVLNRHKIPAIFVTRQYNVSPGNRLAFEFGLIDEENSIEVITNALKNVGIETDNMEETAGEILNFINNLTKYAQVHQQAPTQSRVMRNLKDVQNDVQEFDFKKYLETYFEVSLDTIRPAKIRCGPVENFRNLVNFIQNTNKRVLANYFMYKVANHLSRNMKIATTTNEFDLITNKIFIRQMMTQEDEKIAKDVCDEMNRSVEKIKNQLPQETYSKAKQTINHQCNLIKNHEKIISNEVLDKIYGDFNVQSDNHLQNILNLLERENKKSFQRLVGGQNKGVTNTGLLDDSNELYEMLQTLQGHPAASYFAQIGYNMWRKIIFYHLSTAVRTDENGKNLENVINCVGKAYNTNSGSIIEEHINYNEAMKLIMNEFENWMKANQEMSQKDNEILSEFNLNNKKLLVLLLSRNLCNKSNHFELIQGNMPNNQIVKDTFHCTKDLSTHAKCGNLYNTNA